MMVTGPTILGTADSTCYLVGNTDSNGNFLKLPNLDEIVVCKSLVEAKALLKSNDYEQAVFIVESAYDEMCGGSDKADGIVAQTVKF